MNLNAALREPFFEFAYSRGGDCVWNDFEMR